MVWNRRLYLFWATFEDKPDPDKTEELGVPDILETDAEHDDWLTRREKFHKWQGEGWEFNVGDEFFDELNSDLVKIGVKLKGQLEDHMKPPAKPLDFGPEPNAEQQAEGHEAWLQRKQAHDDWAGRSDERKKLNDYFESLRAALVDSIGDETDWTIMDQQKLIAAITGGNETGQEIWDRVTSSSYISSASKSDPLQEPEEPGPEPTPKPEAKAPVTRWEIKLSWAEYRQNRWSPKQTAKTALISGLHKGDNGGGGPLQTPLEHSFWAPITAGGTLLIF